MREALRWAVRKPRVWLAAAGFLAATVLALADRRPAWAAFVVTATGILAWSAVAAQYAADHPDAAARAAARVRAKEQARVAAALRRYEARHAAAAAVPEPVAAGAEDPAPRPPRVPRRRRRQQARVEAILWRYERQRLARERAREQR